MANTIATSTIATATAYSASQRVAVSVSGDSLVLWHDGSNVKWSYASSPYSTWTTATLTVSTKTQFSLYKLANDDVLAVVAQSTNMVSYYFTYSAGSHSWSVGGAVTVLASGVGTNGGNLFMDMDAQGRIWAAWESGITTTQVYNTANNGTSWSASTTFAEVSGGAANAVTLAYIGNYIVVTTCATAGAGALYYARIDAHSASLGSWSTPVAVTNAAADNAVTSMCLRGVPGSNLGILADDEYTALPTQRYDANADTWSTVTNIGAAVADKNPTLVGDGTDLYCVWSKQTAANNFSLVYKKWATATQTWDAASTELEANGTNISFVGGGYGFGLLAFVYTVGTATPWSVNFDTKVFVQQSPAITKRLYMPYAIPRALGGTIIPQVILPPVIYEPRALGSTLLTDARIFIPRALGGTYVQDDPTLLWVPHALGGTTQVQMGVALASTIPAIGLESTTLSLSTALTGTIPGVGLLAPTLTASVALSSTLVALGVLTPSAFTESTAFTDTIPAVGVLSGTLLASLGLATTIPAVGTLTGTFTESTALTGTLPGIGTLTGSLSTSTNVNLAVTIPAVGTVTMAGAALSTALATTIPAVGVLNPALTASMSLASLSIPAVGTIVGTLGASAPLSSTVAGVGTLSATMAESTSLTATVSVIGTLTGTLTVGNSVSFVVTIPAVGTLTASAPGLKTALTVSIVALGTISPGATFSEALSGTTLVAVGTISGSASLAVILGTTLAGVGAISATYQVRTALSLQLMALGALLGTIRVPATFFGPYSATESTSPKLVVDTHTVTSGTSEHSTSSYTSTRG